MIHRNRKSVFFPYLTKKFLYAYPYFQINFLHFNLFLFIVILVFNVFKFRLSLFSIRRSFHLIPCCCGPVMNSICSLLTNFLNYKLFNKLLYLFEPRKSSLKHH
uniref:Uncharacterized protein n=1 Tax=Heterorhabditis bacteriophora TaxID=37862 RepID=A0A1I7WSB7_HETBA